MNSIKHLIKTALKEDIGPGDITTDNLVDPDFEGKGVIIAKEPFVIAGLASILNQEVLIAADPIFPQPVCDRVVVT